MRSVALSPEFREKSLQAMAAEELDILVIGGGVVGAGSALDAATRGLNVGLVEARDFASGTSSRSSKLVHGGLRYLEMLDFRLVAEALKERGLLLQELAPHLVHPVRVPLPAAAPVVGALLRRLRRRAVRRHVAASRGGPASRCTSTSPGAGPASWRRRCARTPWSAR